MHGTEFTDAAMSICEGKKLRMQRGRLDPAAYDGEPFDVVTYFEVLEHINNPLEEVSNLCRVLREGGLLYFTTPNFNAVERLVLKDKYSIISYPEHLSYYTPKTMHYLLDSFGFTKVDVETTGISVTRVRNSLGLTDQRLVSETSDDEVIRITLEASRGTRAVKSVANKILTLLGVGNSIKGFYERARS